MEWLFHPMRLLLHRPPSPHGISSRMMSSGFTTLDNAAKIEEETMPTYGVYYPVHFGELFKSRYEVLSKLGYGANSTVWFCWDLDQHKYAALKVYRYCSHGPKKLEVLKYLAAVKSEHSGKAYVRTMIDSFVVNSPVGEHHCLVHEPLPLNLLELQAILPRKRLSLDLLKQTLKQLLLALDYLHTDARVIHTDIQARNILLGTLDQSVYEDMDAAEVQEPSPRKEGFADWGLPVLCDLGEARIGTKHKGVIQPNSFRSPEVILGMEWDCKVDIWNATVMAWHLFEDDHLFDGRILGKHSDAQLLAEIASVLGPPPKEFLERSQDSLKYWDAEGKWKGTQDTEIKPNPFDDCEEGKDYELFVNFFRRMLAWDPKERSTAGKLLQDQFLKI
ncbi:kinase domain-containing protein [Rhexocercosporidium sp. MPI-PUGE-AT-0058]|nr:kinase domain-containing protein [Rhexocercosporidium sp. MPI-PUGE-AT-0058]